MKWYWSTFWAMKKGYVLLISGTDSYFEAYALVAFWLEIQLKAFRNCWIALGKIKKIKSTDPKPLSFTKPCFHLKVFESIKQTTHDYPRWPIAPTSFEALVVAEDLPFPEAYLIAQSDVWYQYSLTVNAQIKNCQPIQKRMGWVFLTQFQEDYQTPLVFGTKETKYLSPFLKVINFKMKKLRKRHS